MGIKRGVNLDNFVRIHRRQSHNTWGPDYKPAIMAIRGEAPSISRASILTPDVLRREVHLLSLSERYAALLALYSPWFRGLQEQRVLFPLAAPHPLFGVSGVSNVLLPPINGVIDVAERLGALRFLPKIRVPDPANKPQSRVLVFPYVGDLLLCLDKGEGPYCVNWSIKNSEESFKRPLLEPRRKENSKSEGVEELLSMRNRIEDAYYADAGIKTYRIAGEKIDKRVVSSLEILFGYHRRSVGISSKLQDELRERYLYALNGEIKPIDIIVDIVSRGHALLHDCKAVLYQSIWRRTLRVDLFKPILLDKPLRKEEKDLMSEFAQWFEG